MATSKLSNSCVIIGCGAHAHAVVSIIESSFESYQIKGLIDIQEKFDPNEEKSGYKVITNINEFLDNYHKYLSYNCFIAIGDNGYRKEVFDKLKNKGFKLPNLISKTAFIDRTVIMGEANVIAHNVVINAQSKIGNNNLINTSSVIEHDCKLGNHNHVAPRAVLCGSVNMSDLVFLGAGSTILPKLTVSTGTLIGAASLLNECVCSEYLTYVGIPAKVKRK